MGGINGAALIYTALPALALLFAGALALWRPPQAGWRAAILHFAVGLVFAVVAVELIPDLLREGSRIAVAGGFLLGVLAMLALSRFSAPGERQEAQAAGLSLALLAPIAVDIAIDGLLLGIGFAAGVRAGQLLGLALAVEFVSLGLALVATLLKRGRPAGEILGLLGALAGLFALFAVAGTTALQGLNGFTLSLMLAFGAAALLFLITEELLVEAHEVEHRAVFTAAFFGGFLLLLLLAMGE